MDWDYDKREVHLSMPGYVQKALKRFQHENQTNPNINHTLTIPSSTALKLNTLNQRIRPHH
jgi:hypothetical protein